jgi:hypothetical protein
MKKILNSTRILTFLMLTGLTLSMDVPETVATVDTFSSAKGTTSENTVRIALLLDTSNSMDGLINQAKAQLWDIVNQFTQARCADDRRPGLKIALYQYGNDDLSAREGYIQQVTGFTSDLDELSAKLFSLHTNGGEEYCGQVIQASLGQLNWGNRRQDLNLIFIAGNEPFTQGKLDFRDAITNAREKDVIVNTVFCGNFAQGINGRWKEGAEIGGGEYMAIDHNRQAVHIATPYDDVIIRLNSRLNRTYISYGARGAGRHAQQAAQDANAMEMESAVAVKRALSKSSNYYSNPSWDLVDAAEEEDFELSSINRDQLPQELKDKSEKEILSHIQAKKEERTSLQNQIHELNAKREDYIAGSAKTEEGELQSAMLEAIRKQASEKDYHWE